MPELPAHLPLSSRRTTCADKNDRLGWVDGFSVTVDGVSVGLRCNDAALLARLREMLPPWHLPGSKREVDVLLSFILGKPSGHAGVRHYHVVYLHWSRVARTMELDEALAAFRTTLLTEIAARAQGPLYLEGRVVDMDRGPVLVIGAQEDTEPVAEALARQGRRLTPPDLQYVAVTESNEIRCTARDTIKPGMMLLVDPASRRRIRPERVTAGVSVLHLMRHAPSFLTQPQGSLPALVRLAAAVESYQGAYQKPENAVALTRRPTR